MDTRIIKALITLGILTWAIFEFIDGNIWSGVFITLLAALSGLFVFRSIRLLMAFLRMRTQKFDKAKVWIDRVKRPDLLWKSQEAYFYYLSGLLESQSQSLSSAEKNFKKALSVGLRMDYDKAVAKMNLAVIAASKGRQREATILLSEVKKLDTKNMLKEEIKQISQAMKKGPTIAHRRY